jgi:hypothetical protein
MIGAALAAREGIGIARAGFPEAVA